MSASTTASTAGVEHQRLALCVDRSTHSSELEELGSLDALMRRYSQLVSRVAWTVTRSDRAAEDITQNVFIRVWTRGGYDSSRGSLSSWLQMVTQHAAIDWVRSELARQRRQERFVAMEGPPTSAVDADHAGRIDAEVVRAAVAQLPPAERAVIQLAFYDRLTYRVVAVRLGISEGTAKTQIRRALMRLRVALDKAQPVND